MRSFRLPRFIPSRSAKAAVSIAAGITRTREGASSDRGAGLPPVRGIGGDAGRGDRGADPWARSSATASASSAVLRSSWATRSPRAAPPAGAAVGAVMLISQSRTLSFSAAAWARQLASTAGGTLRFSCSSATGTRRVAGTVPAITAAGQAEPRNFAQPRCATDARLRSGLGNAQGGYSSQDPLTWDRGAGAHHRQPGGGRQLDRASSAPACI